MSSKESLNVSGVRYHQAADDYFEKRQLTRAAGFWGLWGIGVAAVISGDFSGWNFGIGEAGWGGLAVASVVIVTMYFGMLFSIGEMSAAMPHTGGAYSFARAAMGPWGGFVTGLAETIEYVFTTGVIVLFSAGYLNFLGIEELPLAAEEAHNPQKDIPRAGIVGLLTLCGTGAIVFFLNPAVTGSEALGASGEPLLDGFRQFLSADLAALLSLFALIGLLASLQGIMFAYGRNMYSLSRAGYYPKVLSITGARRTPWVSLLAGAVFGFVVLLLIDFLNRRGGAIAEQANAIVLNIAVWGAVLAYLLQMVSFVLLRRKFPTARRPYVSPTGVAGAVVAGIIAAITFIGVFINPDFRPAIIAIAVVYAIGLLLFGFVGRHRLVLSPEEEYAVTGGLHGYDPEAEGLGGTIEDEILKGHTN